jgi:hypothetical protein
MTNEEKQLLLKDLCARLPYKTRVRYTFAFAGAVCITGYSDEGILSYDKLQDFSLPNGGYETRRVVNILPYLRPMSSMTDNEERELEETLQYTQYTLESYDWLNKHHFDYRGLIDKGLALEAPEDMYKI